jgi:hypothetical protein
MHSSRFTLRAALGLGITASVALLGATGGCSSGNSGTVFNTPDSSTADTGPVGCGAGSQQCSGVCTVVARDTENCGACGKKCAAGELCSAGACASSCGTTTTKCGSECVDTKSDPRNCGACGTKCSGGQVCNAGACAIDCGTLLKCGSSCIDSQTDRTNCGACGTVCGAGELCTAGKCTLSCQQGLTKCTSGDGGVSDGGLGSTFCANLASDNSNCGACGTVCTAPKSCNNGTCQSGCINGQTLCTPDAGVPYCASTQTDNANCGTCGTVCGSGLKCVAGVCSANKIDALICTGDLGTTNNNDIQSKLMATGAFNKVDLMACTGTTPTLLQLGAYASVLVLSNNTFSNPAALGDVLADYVDAGGYVVVASFAYATGYALTGRWISGGYNLIAVGGYASTSETTNLQIVDLSSPLVAGVNTFTASTAFHNTTAVANGGIVVARWGTSATPLIVRGVKNSRARVDLNMFPPSNAAVSGYWIGDGATIMKNALLFR